MSTIPAPEVILAQAKELLLKTADIFEADPESWTQGAMARRKLGAAERAVRMLAATHTACDLYEDVACQHCVVGKLYNVSHKTPRDHNYGYVVSNAAFTLAHGKLKNDYPAFFQSVRDQSTGSKHIVIQFNDDPITTVADVIKLLRSAAAA